MYLPQKDGEERNVNVCSLHLVSLGITSQAHVPYVLRDRDEKKARDMTLPALSWVLGPSRPFDGVSLT